LPGLNGFVGEFLIFVGAFHANAALTVVAVSGVVLGAVYMLWMYQRVMFGPLDRPENEQLTDMTPREIAVMLPIIALIILMGVYPKPFLATIEKSVESTVARAVATRVAEIPAIPATPTEIARSHSGEF
jgi:NADH-quinone oxidoreductase subunit M